MSAFAKLSQNYHALTDVEKVNLFKSTAVEEPAVVDLQTIGKFKVLIYKETTP